MTSIADLREMRPRIIVFGVGGGGGNAINNMIAAGLQGVDFVVANTDAQALTASKAPRTIQMGVEVTEGLGAGSQPEVGHAAAEEAIDAIYKHLTGAHMVFITAAIEGDVELARQAVERTVVENVEVPFKCVGTRVDKLLRVDACGRRAGDVADIVGAGAARAQPQILDRLDHGDRIRRLDLADLDIGTGRHMRITAAVALG